MLINVVAHLFYLWIFQCIFSATITILTAEFITVVTKIASNEPSKLSKILARDCFCFSLVCSVSIATMMMVTSLVLTDEEVIVDAYGAVIVAADEEGRKADEHVVGQDAKAPEIS